MIATNCIFLMKYQDKNDVCIQFLIRGPPHIYSTITAHLIEYFEHDEITVIIIHIIYKATKQGKVMWIGID
jgi:hypothetical protein